MSTSVIAAPSQTRIGAVSAPVGAGALVTLLKVIGSKIVGFVSSMQVEPITYTKQGALMMQRMANELEMSQPSMAAELRAIAARDNV